MGYFPLMLLF